MESKSSGGKEEEAMVRSGGENRMAGERDLYIYEDD